jgi:hypothetical protein
MKSVNMVTIMVIIIMKASNNVTIVCNIMKANENVLLLLMWKYSNILAINDKYYY